MSKIYVGADHNGYELKRSITEFLRRNGYDVVDEGDVMPDAQDDFPQFAGRVVAAMLSGNEPDPQGILICGSGQGMCMAANRFKGIRAALCWDAREARMSRNDDDANVLCLPARMVDEARAQAVLSAWLSTPFAGAPRFRRRIAQLDELG